LRPLDRFSTLLRAMGMARTPLIEALFQGNAVQDRAWYYMDRRGQRQGPVADTDVVATYRRGDLLRDGLVWREGMPQWLPLAQVENDLGIGPSDHPAAPPPLPEGPRHLAMAAATHSRSVDRNDIVYAGFVRRFAALLLDNLILAVPLWLIAILLSIPLGLSSSNSGDRVSAMAQGVYYLLWLIASPLYFAGQESSAHQATLGKRALGIKVTDDNGQRLSFSHALGRWFATALSYLTFYIGFLMAAFTERKRALHDMVASTLVVDRWAYTEFPERQQRSPSGCLIAFIIGFLLVIPVTAILAAIAISQYQDYVIRSQVSEGSALADGVKTAVAEFVNNTGRFPNSNASAGLAAPGSISGQYVSAVNIASAPGQVQATMSGFKANTAIYDKVLIFSAITQAGSIEWHCKSTSLKQKWCASSCACSG
jgi:uncharacterized RDD family membrane protein YckC/Tfp pilus assembly protein PilE